MLPIDKKRKGKNGLVLCKKLRITTSSSSNKNKTEISIGEFFLICAEANWNIIHWNSSHVDFPKSFKFGK